MLHNFKYDPFQQQAIDAISEGHSVLVSAPTGSGKTAIAEYVIERALERRERVIYTAPIKAISNQKYRDFLGTYPNDVGILTGDVSINPDAPVLIMTTEIYRNQLFENPDKHRKTAWVIFDEVHYLDDYERGTVWEEAFMFSHPETRYVCLSATAPNIQELAHWIEMIHGHKIVVVTETKRPVELVHYFQCQNQIYQDIHRLKKDGYMGMDTWARAGRGGGHGGSGGRGHGGRHGHGGGRRGREAMRDWRKELKAKPNSTHDLLNHLIEADKLPCLYFAFGRRRVEELAHEHTHLDLCTPEESNENRRLYEELAVKYELTQEPSAKEMRSLVAHGIAYHHAGMLPTLKEVVEQLFTKKKIKLIFTTETFALGINMPARTVVFDELRKFYGFGFDNLTTRDYFQMAGRAGRRGIDTVGYVYSRVNPHFIPWPAINKVVNGDMEPILSQFNASYATLLNLFKRLGRRLIDVYPKSLHFYQSNAKNHKKGIANIERKLQVLESLGHIKGDILTPKGQFASSIYGYELILSELLESGFLNNLGPADLSVLLAALVYEPRKNEFPRRLPVHFQYLEREAKKVLHHIYQVEGEAKIFPNTKPPHFHLTTPVEAWMRGAQFHDLQKMTDIDEGIIIRYFRMVIQLLREIESANGVSDKLRETCRKSVPLIDRDIVDAEKLLKKL